MPKTSASTATKHYHSRTVFQGNVPSGKVTVRGNDRIQDFTGTLGGFGWPAGWVGLLMGRQLLFLVGLVGSWIWNGRSAKMPVNVEYRQANSFLKSFPFAASLKYLFLDESSTQGFICRLTGRGIQLSVAPDNWCCVVRAACPVQDIGVAGCIRQSTHLMTRLSSASGSCWSRYVHVCYSSAQSDHQFSCKGRTTADRPTTWTL